MSIAPLVLFTAMAAAPTPGPDPAALVAKLGSAEAAVRSGASESLRAIGRDALPALEEAMKGGDAAVRERASAVWETIQRDLMMRPTMVRLDAQGRSLSLVLQDLERQSGLTLQRNQSGPERPVNLREPAPVTFWTALDRLGLGGIYFQNPGKGQLPILHLSQAPAPPFTSPSGPFRVTLTGLHLHRDRTLIRGPWDRIDQNGQRINVPAEDPVGETVSFFGDLDVMVEPRMWFTQEAPARLVDATDDLGQSLVPDPARLHDPAHPSFYAGRDGAQVRTEFRLRTTGRPGRVARLRGVVPLMLQVRRPGPTLVIPLAGASGKTFRCDDAEFTFGAVSDSERSTNLTFSARLNVARADLPENPARDLIWSRLNVMDEHQLEIIDASGKVLLPASGSGSSDGRDPSIYRWTRQTMGRATHLRYYSVVRVRAEAAFDFRDVPLP